jgi:hypothetical protein
VAAPAGQVLENEADINLLLPVLVIKHLIIYFEVLPARSLHASTSLSSTHVPRIRLSGQEQRTT